MRVQRNILIAALCVAPIAAHAAEISSSIQNTPVSGGSEDRWWPIQKEPNGILRLELHPPDDTYTYSVAAQSLAGLAAKAVNAGDSNQLVWVATGNEVLEQWLQLRQQDNDHFKTTRTVTKFWDLVEIFAKSGIVKGYILYKADASQGNLESGGGL
jgi:hypothetical protein